MYILQVQNVLGIGLANLLGASSHSQSRRQTNTSHYNNSVWSPHKKSDTEKLERVQKRATKMICGMPKISYPDRLRKFKLPTLTYRRARGDMTETYKLLSGKYDDQASLQLKSKMSLLPSDYKTTGNSCKLEVRRCRNCRCDLRKYSFSNHITNLCNSLPDSVVMADTVNQFKNRLDKHWANGSVPYRPQTISATTTSATRKDHIGQKE